MASTFDQLLERGYQYVLIAEIDQIPWLFSETIPQRATVEGPPPTVLNGVCPALFFDEGVEFSQELDREEGASRGDAIDLCLSWEALEEMGLTQSLFSRPTKKVRLTADVDASDTTWSVESTDGWSPGDTGYIGIETVRITRVVDATTLEVERYGDRFIYKTASPTTFSFLTDRPEVWRRRPVTIYKQLLSPEGRLLSEIWGGGEPEYLRWEWRGYVDGPPRPGTKGMYLRCLPLQRLAAEELGYELSADVVTPDPEDHISFARLPIVVTPESTIRIHGEWNDGGTSGSFDYTFPSIDGEYAWTIADWCYAARQALNTLLFAEPWYVNGSADVACAGHTGWYTWDPEYAGTVIVYFGYDPDYEVTDVVLSVNEAASTYWLSSGQQRGDRDQGIGSSNWAWGQTWPYIIANYPVGSWLPVLQAEGQGYLDLAIPSSGSALVEVEGNKELIRWDRTLQMTGQPIVLLHLAERGVAGTPLVELAGGAKLTFATGAAGTPAECVLQMLESSGTGERGTYDTLGLGLGLGVPQSAIDVVSFDRAELSESTIAAFSDGRTSLEDLMGGWLALTGQCLGQRGRSPDEPVKLTLIRTEPTALIGDEVIITAADVELGGVDTPEIIDAPNEIRISRSGVAVDLPDVVNQDIPALQASLVRSGSFSAPGMSVATASDLGGSRMALGPGQSATTLAIAPWVPIQIGDQVGLATQHPGSYDWQTGTRAPALLPGIVAGLTFSPYDGRRTATILTAGLAREGLFLCPTATVTVEDTTSIFTVDLDLERFFSPDQANITALTYNVGDEATESETTEYQVLSGNRLQRVSGSHPAWLGVGTKVTFTPLGGNNPLIEGSYMFRSSSRAWGA